MASERLPEGWEACEDDSSNVYFHHRASSTSVWTVDEALAAAAAADPADPLQQQQQLEMAPHAAAIPEGEDDADAAASRLRSKLDPSLVAEFDDTVALLRASASASDAPPLVDAPLMEFRPAGALPFARAGEARKRRLAIVAAAAAAALLVLVVTLAVVLTRGGGDADPPAVRAARALDGAVDDSFAPKTGELLLPAEGRLGPFLAAAVGAFGGLLRLDGAAEVGEDVWRGGGVRDEVAALLLSSLDRRVFRGRWRFGVSGAADAECVVGLFFDADETEFAADTVQAVAECAVDAGWDARQELPALRAAGALWFDALQLRLEASVVASTAEWREPDAASSDQGTLPRFLRRGVSLFGRFSARAGAPAALFGGAFDLVSPEPAAMDPFEVQLSLPLNATGGTADGGAPSGRVTLPAATVLVSGAGALRPAPGVELVLDGADAAGAPLGVSLSAALAVQYPDRGGEASFALAGVWDRAAQSINMTGAMRGAGWLPFDGELVAVVSASASARVSTAGGSLSLSEADLEGEAVLLYGDARAAVSARAVLTGEETLLEVRGFELGNLTALVEQLLERGRPGTLAGQSARLLSSRHVLLSGGRADAVFCSGGALEGRARGLTLVVEGVQMAADAYGGAALVEPLLRAEPSLLATLDLEVYVPVFEDQDSAGWYLTFLARGADVDLAAAAGLEVALDSVAVSVRSDPGGDDGDEDGGGGGAGVAVDVAARALVRTGDGGGELSAVAVAGSYFNGTLRLVGTVEDWRSPFGADWVTMESATASLVLPPGGGPPATLDFLLLARLEFADPEAPPLSARVAFGGGGACMLAESGTLAQFHAAASRSFDAAVSVSLCSSAAGGEVGGVELPGGLRARAEAVAASDDALDGTLSALAATEGGGPLVGAVLVAEAPLSAPGEPAPGVAFTLTVPEIVVAGAARLENSTLEVAFGGAEAVSFELESFFVLSPPQDGRDLPVALSASYGSDEGVLAAGGTLPAWPAPFGLAWLDVGTTEVALRAPRRPEPKSISLSGSVTVRPTPSSSVGLTFCGAVQDGDAAITVSGVAGGTVAALVCRTMGVCDPSSLLDSSGVASGTAFEATVATGRLTAAAWRDPSALCTFAQQPFAGVSLSVAAPLAGELAGVIQGAVSGGITGGAGGEWRFRVNIPFAAAPSPEMMAATHRGDAKAVRRMLELGLRPQGLSAVRDFNVNFENAALAVPVGSWFNITGAGVTGRPFAAPPEFAAWLSFTVELEGNEAPLDFYAEGAVEPPAVRLTGQMLVGGDGWVNPFGIRGLVVRGAAVSVGFSATALDSLGLAFDVIIGRVSVYFSGLVSLSGLTRSSYLIGSIRATDSGRISLLDLADAVEEMSGGAVDIPSSVLPGPDVLSLQHAEFKLASADGTDLLGNTFTRGLFFSARAVVFSVDLAVSVQTRTLPSGLTDLAFSATANFAEFNRKVVGWLTSFIPFNIGDYLGLDGASLCSIACVNELSLTDVSVLGLLGAAGTETPTFAFSVSLFGTQHDLVVPLSASLLGFSMDAFLDSVRDALGDFFSLCVFDFNCGSGEECDFPLCSSKCGAGEVFAAGACRSCPAGTYYSTASASCVPVGLSPMSVVSRPAPPRDFDALKRDRWARYLEHMRTRPYGPEPQPWYERSGVNIYDCDEYEREYRRHLADGRIRVHEGRVLTVSGW